MLANASLDIAFHDTYYFIYLIIISTLFFKSSKSDTFNSGLKSNDFNLFEEVNKNNYNEKANKNYT